MTKKENNKVTMQEFIRENFVLNSALEGKTYHDTECIEDIKNPTLKSKLKSYIKEENKGKKAAWEMVRLIASMSEVIKEDFGSDYKFAEFMECSQATINKRKRLGNYAVDLQAEGYSDTQAMEMLPLLSKAEEIINNNFDDSIAQEEGRTKLVQEIALNIPNTLSQKDIRKEVKNLTAFWDIDEGYARIMEKTDIDSLNNEETSSQSLEELDDTETPTNEETYITYTVPWLESGALVDAQIEVSEEVAKQIAKSIMDIMNE